MNLNENNIIYFITFSIYLTHKVTKRSVFLQSHVISFIQLNRFNILSVNIFCLFWVYNLYISLERMISRFYDF